MPIYCYKCKKCGKHEEIFYRNTEASEREHRCDDCGGLLEKIMAPAAVIFKGSGFYETDYKHQHASVETGGGESKADEPPKAEAAPKAESAKADSGKGKKKKDG